MNNVINCPDGCSTIGSQRAKICLPVSVIPYAITSPAIINCCGNTKISSNCECNCKGDSTSCDFVISQIINVDVPVEFGASVKIGETYIQCNVDEGLLDSIDDEIQEPVVEIEFPVETSHDKSEEYVHQDYNEDENDPYLGA